MIQAVRNSNSKIVLIFVATIVVNEQVVVGKFKFPGQVAGVNDELLQTAVKAAAVNKCFVG